MAFTSYGAFWLTLVALIVMPKLGWIPATSTRGMICYLSMWGLFTFLLFIGTLKLNRALQVVFGSLTLLFFFTCYRRQDRKRIDQGVYRMGRHFLRLFSMVVEISYTEKALFFPHSSGTFQNNETR